jgi:NAD+ synthase (glutamine-hydrolysing)
MIRIAIAQINSTVGDLAGNQQKIVDYIHRAKGKAADIVIFPELAICGYPPEDLLLKDHFVKDNMKILQSLIKKVHGITAVIGFVDTDRDKNLFNAAAVIQNRKLAGVYHKEELPNYGVFDEKRYFQAGTINKVFAHGKVCFGVTICEDIWIEDGIYKRQAKRCTHLLINISSSPYDLGKLQQREKLLKNRAKQTKTFICYANLVGGQDELVFDGGSIIVDPKGKIVASGKQFEEDLILADLSINNIKSKTFKQPIKRHLSKRFSQIERIYKALVLGTRDYMRKNGFQKVVIGLSGGIDSSLVAVLAVKVIGKENVIGVIMPSRYSSMTARSDARKLAKRLGIKTFEIPIEEIFKAYLKTLSKEFAGLKPDVAEENIQARIRGNILMALSNKFGWLVLTTGNKSEVAVGYCTLYGDMSGGFAVIKDVPKSKVYELARFINKREDNLIPEGILKRAPSAELRENQKDQDALPPYEFLDDLLKDYIEKQQSLAKMSRNKDKELIKEIIKLVDRNEYKRRQAPPGIKITPRAFGKDWRLPITNKYKEF